ncbi:C1 family peptidase [Aestuariibacter sp. A3R04]|uniref:C1 family peptidase n=1 Tax=Aestuariibacter sp. A3R04 TaxID=2841571 RepID=UPI001C08DFEE|nr:C1 family peptidase [Aestuariibacter sp. A3R04]MBU3023739.1 C1 family peptidase [Aestuariibacter sp. A3R04]
MPNHQYKVASDAPDLRDRIYQPLLKPLKPFIDPPGNLTILNQGADGACTGFGLAATINFIYRQQGLSDKVSPWMLYTMAKRYDEWLGENYEGSSCRGAIKGWHNSGVCKKELTDNLSHSSEFRFTQDIYEDAKKRTLGAYFRLQQDITDFHSALNECGVIFVSAQIHEGWLNYDGHEIAITDNYIGGHAFAIVGYNNDGFWVQNSWGADWKKSGIALWKYEDWAVNIMDAWVVQLALPVPGLFGFYRPMSHTSHATFFNSVSRLSIQHHFIHLDDGHFHDSGKYWTSPEDIAPMLANLQKSGCKKVLLYAHGGLNSVKSSAQRIAAMKQTFLDNGIYPIHFMYDTGLLEEIRDVLACKNKSLEGKAGGIFDWIDRRLEDATRKIGSAIWREMKSGAQKPFVRKKSDGSVFLSKVLEYLSANPDIELYACGHSTGAILHAYGLNQLSRLDENAVVKKVFLMAPAINYTLFRAQYNPLLQNGNIEKAFIFNLTKEQELDDTVGYIYQKSLLYLVSNAFEETREEPLVGMQYFNEKQPPLPDNVTVVYSNESSDVCRSVSHGGFDNDRFTMNTLLREILDAEPTHPFTKKTLDY